MVGFLAHCLATIHRYIAVGHLPITNMHESLSFFALSIVAAYLYFEFRFKVTTLGSFVLPLVTLLLIGSSSFPE